MPKPEQSTPQQQPPNSIASPATGSAEISTPHIHDVLCERGRMANGHPGNVYFRLVTGEHKRSYVMNGMNGAHEVVKAVKSLVPPGRFLKRQGDFWFEVDHKKALEKARQCLSEGRPQLHQILAAGRDAIGPDMAYSCSEQLLPDYIASDDVSLSKEIGFCPKKAKKDLPIPCNSVSEPGHQVQPNMPQCPSFISAPCLNALTLCHQQVSSSPSHYPLEGFCDPSVYGPAGEESSPTHQSKPEFECSSYESSVHWAAENTKTVTSNTTESSLVRLASTERLKKGRFESDRSKSSNPSTSDDKDMQTLDISHEQDWLNLIDSVQPTDVCDLNRWSSEGMRSDISDELQALDLNSDLISKMSHQHLAWNSDSSRSMQSDTSVFSTEIGKYPYLP